MLVSNVKQKKTISTMHDRCGQWIVLVFFPFFLNSHSLPPLQPYSKWKVRGGGEGVRVGFIKGEAGSLSHALGFFSPPQHAAQTVMEALLLLLFPQFSHTAQKQEVCCRMLAPGASRALKMKEDSSGSVLFRSDSEESG